MDPVYQKVIYNSCFFLLSRHGIQKNKRTYPAQVKASLCFTQKNNFCIMNKINMV